MYIGEIIKDYRLKNNLSQRAFASRTSLSPSYINTLEKVYNPKNNKPYSVTTDVAIELANAMFISIEELLKMISGNQEFNLNSNQEPHILTLSEKGEEFHKQAFPILGKVKAGYNYLAQENWTGLVSIDKEVADPENYFALSVTGNSMEPILYEDDIVIVHSQNDVENGQVGIVLINNEEATIKKIQKYDNHIELVAFNSYYPVRKLTKDDNFSIIGKVVEGRISKIFE